MKKKKKRLSITGMATVFRIHLFEAYVGFVPIKAIQESHVYKLKQNEYIKAIWVLITYRYSRMSHYFWTYI